MGVRVFTNNAEATLASSISSGTTTLTLGTGQGSKFASPSGGDWQDVTLDDGVHIEICRLTARSGDTLTVTRAQESTTAQSFAVGTRVEARWTAGAAVDAFDHRGVVQTLTDGATISVDAGLANNFRVTLGGNRTLANPTNLISGQVLNFRIAQDGTGSRTLAYGSKYKFPGGTAPVLSTAVSAKDFMSCQYDATDDTLVCVLNKAFS